MGHKPGSITHIYTIWYLTIVTIENHHGSQLIEDAANPSSKVQWRNHQSVARMPAATIRTSGCIWTAVEWPKKKGFEAPVAVGFILWWVWSPKFPKSYTVPQTVDVPSDNNQI